MFVQLKHVCLNWFPCWKSSFRISGIPSKLRWRKRWQHYWNNHSQSKRRLSHVWCWKWGRFFHIQSSYSHGCRPLMVRKFLWASYAMLEDPGGLWLPSKTAAVLSSLHVPKCHERMQAALSISTIAAMEPLPIRPITTRCRMIFLCGEPRVIPADEVCIQQGFARKPATDRLHDQKLIVQTR